MKKLLVVLGLAATVITANAANNPVGAKKCKAKVKHGVLRTKGKCERAVPVEQVNTVIIDTVATPQPQTQPGYYGF